MFKIAGGFHCRGSSIKLTVRNVRYGWMGTTKTSKVLPWLLNTPDLNLIVHFVDHCCVCSVNLFPSIPTSSCEIAFCMDSGYL